MIGFIIVMIITVFVISVFVAISSGNKEEKSSPKKEENSEKKERLIDKFNKLYIGQSLYSVQEQLGRKCELKEERLLREEKLLNDKDVIKKVYVWKFDRGLGGFGYIRCTFYNDKLSAKEQSNLD